MSDSSAPGDTTETKQLLQSCTKCATLLDVSDYELFAQIHCPICGTALRARSEFLHFQLLGLLGEGGMGAVYRAVDVRLNRPTALKVVKREHAANPEYIEKFEHEAQITASVNHPHVVKVYSFGEHQGIYYIAMELVDKGTLDSLIGLQGRVAEAQVLEFGVQIAEGLKAAYDNGLIHRDVKPGNILFSDAHTAKIVDFGLALLMEEEAAARGEVWGTPYYVAPEKLNHEPEDHRSDIYSLGGTLFHALAGRPPFEAETASMVALKHIKSRAISLQAFAPDVSSSTAYVINRMLAKNPDDRYQSYDELIEHLTYARNELMESMNKPKAPKQRLVLESEENKSIFGWISLGVLAIIVILGIVAFVFREQLFTTEAERQAKAKELEKQRILQMADAQNREFESARRLIVDGDFASAQAAFKKLAAEKETKPVLAGWIILHEGIAASLAERREEAMGAFSRLAKVKSSPNPEDAPILDLFQNISVAWSSSSFVNLYTVRRYKTRNQEAIAPFVFGLKNWSYGEYIKAGDLFAIYLKSTPAEPYAWTGDYKPVAQKYADSAAAYAKLVEALQAADSPEKIAAAKTLLYEARDKSQVQGLFTDRLNEIEKKLDQSDVAAAVQLTKAKPPTR